MRIAVTSDHHFHAYQQFANRTPGGLNNRLVEMLAVEDLAHALRQRLDVDLHIRAGDLFDRKNTIDAVTFNEVWSRVSRRGGPPEWLLKGNHDIAAGGIRHTLEAFASLPTVKVFDTPQRVEIGNASVYLVPHMEDVAEQRAALGTFPLETDNERFKLLICHGQVAGAISGSEYVLPGSLTLEDLHAEAYDLVLLGHCHEPHQLAPNVFYVGSQCQRSFADIGAARRMFLVDTDARRWDSHPLLGPRFQREIFSTLSTFERWQPSSNDYYKVVVRSPEITDSLIKDKLEGYCRGWTVQYEIAEKTIAPRLGHGLISWDDILEVYVREIETPLDKKQLLAVGRTLREQSNGG